MCLESSKQTYSLLSAWTDKQSKGLSFKEVRKLTSSYSIREFGFDYVNYPNPLESLVKELASDQEIRRDDEGNWHLTWRGKRARDYIYEAEIRKLIYYRLGMDSIYSKAA